MADDADFQANHPLAVGERNLGRRAGWPGRKKHGGSQDGEKWGDTHVLPKGGAVVAWESTAGGTVTIRADLLP